MQIISKGDREARLIKLYALMGRVDQIGLDWIERNAFGGNDWNFSSYFY